MRSIALLLVLGFSFFAGAANAQTTHFNGLAEIHVVQSVDPATCAPGGIGNMIDTVLYTVFHRGSLPDSISYRFTINTILDTSFIPSNSFYIKNDIDSVIFPVKFFSSHDEHSDVPLTDPCRNYTISQSWDGVVRISTMSAGLVNRKFLNNQPDCFPNPAYGLLLVRSAAGKVSVIDNLGRTMMERTMSKDNFDEFSPLDVSSLQSGCYTLIFDKSLSVRPLKFLKY